MTISGAVSVFAESDKFNGMNWNTWKENITMVVESKGVEGYLDRTIISPTPGKNPVETMASVSPSISPAILT